MVDTLIREETPQERKRRLSREAQRRWRQNANPEQVAARRANANAAQQLKRVDQSAGVNLLEP